MGWWDKMKPYSLLIPNSEGELGLNYMHDDLTSLETSKTLPLNYTCN